MKAKGFVERAEMELTVGLLATQMPLLRPEVPFAQAEGQLMVSWQDPPAWDPETRVETAPPGRGDVLVEVRGRPGTPPVRVEPVHVELSQVERDLALRGTGTMGHVTGRVGPGEPASALTEGDVDLAVDPDAAVVGSSGTSRTRRTRP